MRIDTVVFPVAGRGTRFLPATKASPKEMLPILNKPLMQYAVEEALSAGIERFIFVIAAGKESIREHFSTNQELLHHLVDKNKTDSLLDVLASSLPEDKMHFVIQEKALGLGHAVGCVASFFTESSGPFAVILPDDLYASESEGHESCLQQMKKAYIKQKLNGHMIGIQKVAKEDVNKYGIIDFDAAHYPKQRLIHIKSVVEKPSLHESPSHYAVVGRYILDPNIFISLKQNILGAGGEIQLTDALIPMAQQGKLWGYMPKGHRYDCGSKIGWLQANIAFAARDIEIQPHISSLLKSFQK
jgi:UTP--glucose-1-phosphate uridylyltransferase